MLTKITLEYDTTEARDATYLHLCNHDHADAIRAIPGMDLVLVPADGDDIIEMLAVALAVLR